MFRLHSATAFYGAAAYPVTGLEQLGFATIADEAAIDIDALAAALATCIGGLSAAAFTSLIKIGRTPAAPQFGVPELITARGDGFHIVWKPSEGAKP